MVRPNPGRLPWWLARAVAPRGGHPARRLPRAPGASPAPRRSARSPTASIPQSVLWRRFWDPLARAVAQHAARGGLGATPVGGAARELRPRRRRLPAVDRARQPGGEPDRPGARDGSPSAACRSRSVSGCGRCQARATGRGASISARAQVVLAAADQVILALPPGQTGALLPEIPVPAGKPCDRQRPLPSGAPGPPAGRLAAARPGRRHRGMAVPARGAGQHHRERRRRAGRGAGRAHRRAALGRCRARACACRPHRCRRRGSSRSAARPSPRRRAAAARRPGPVTAWQNLLLAGDWTATGLPATIEGAVRSGQRAAELALAAAAGRR